jgi:hypothetical protein
VCFTWGLGGDGQLGHQTAINYLLPWRCAGECGSGGGDNLVLKKVACGTRATLLLSEVHTPQVAPVGYWNGQRLILLAWRAGGAGLCVWQRRCGAWGRAQWWHRAHSPPHRVSP